MFFVYYSIMRQNILENLPPKGSIGCEKNGKLADRFFIKEKLGDSSAGEAFKVCEDKECNNVFAVKKTPLSQSDVKLLDRPNPVITSVWMELLCMDLCGILVEKNVCPNLPIYYTYYICDNCKFETPTIKLKVDKTGSTKCLYIINEYATDGDFNRWIKTEHDIKSWYSAYFQIFAGLYALQKYFGITHHDFHFGNVLVHKVTPGGYWKYTIDDKVYYVPNCGWVFTLWDFGMAERGKLKPEDVDGMIVPDIDLYVNDYARITNIEKALKDQRVSPNILPTEFGSFIEKIKYYKKNRIILKFVIEDIFSNLYGSKKSQILEKYSMDKEIDVPDEFKQFLLTEAATPSYTYHDNEKKVPKALRSSYLDIHGKTYRKMEILKELKESIPKFDTRDGISRNEIEMKEMEKYYSTTRLPPPPPPLLIHISHGKKTGGRRTKSRRYSRNKRKSSIRRKSKRSGK